MTPSLHRQLGRVLLIDALLNHTLRKHGICDLLETGDICTNNVVTRDFILVGGIVAGPKDIMHGVAQALVCVVEGPRIARRVLLHFQR